MRLLEDVLPENMGGVLNIKWKIEFQDIHSVTQEKEGNPSDDNVSMLKNRGIQESSRIQDNKTHMHTQ